LHRNAVVSFMTRITKVIILLVFNNLGPLIKYLKVSSPDNHLSRDKLKLYIKYMVSARCKAVVKDVLKKLGLHFIVVDLGEVEIMETLSQENRQELQSSLLLAGLELMDDKRAILIEQIKNVIIEMVHHSDELIKMNFSDYLSEKLNYDYTYMSNLFSEVQGSTIEHFIIKHKIERIKELIIYDELNISEIAWKMNYSSVAHLSNQFKKMTGLSPSHFKKLKDKRRNQIEDIN
jgi:AraC-like DNA-binding protein